MKTATTKQITSAEAKYLKHIGAINDTKVTIHIWNKAVRLHIRDQEFTTFASALLFMQIAVAS